MLIEALLENWRKKGKRSRPRWTACTSCRNRYEPIYATRTEPNSLTYPPTTQRAQQIVARLQNAGASILAFTDGGQADQVEMIEDDRAYAHE